MKWNQIYLVYISIGNELRRKPKLLPLHKDLVTHSLSAITNSNKFNKYISIELIGYMCYFNPQITDSQSFTFLITEDNT